MAKAPRMKKAKPKKKKPQTAGQKALKRGIKNMLSGGTMKDKLDAKLKKNKDTIRDYK